MDEVKQILAILRRLPESDQVDTLKAVAIHLGYECDLIRDPDDDDDDDDDDDGFNNPAPWG